jgi:hypothetical protein
MSVHAFRRRLEPGKLLVLGGLSPQPHRLTDEPALPREPILFHHSLDAGASADGIE